jgi:hypothetical protein
MEQLENFLSDGRKVMDWISLFQDSGECMQMESNELAQYPYTKLLREMEVAADSDSDMNEVGQGGDKDDELVHLPEALLVRAMEVDYVHGLPDNLDSLPEIEVDDGLVVAQPEVPDVSDGQ